MEEQHYQSMKELQESWWYEGRRDLYKIFVKKIKLNKNPKILDIGCGTGDNIILLSKFGECYGIDFSNKAVKYCKEKGLKKVYIADALDTKFKSNNFDLVTAFDVMEHIKNDKGFIREIKRILKPSGYAIISVPAFDFLWNENDKLSQHNKRYTKRSIKKLVDKDFDIVKISYWNSTIFFPVMLYCFYERFKKSKKRTNNLNKIPKFMDKILRYVIKIENILVEKANMPFGVSLFLIIRKKGSLS
jgi:ubiquinone/menaquinone biosynthesis C-methylase UbiE